MASAYFDAAYKSKLPDLMKMHNFGYFEICDNKDKVMVYCPTGLTPDQAADFLNENLSGFMEGEFSVSLFESAKKKAISQTFPFKIVNSIAGINLGASVPVADRLALEKKIWELENEKKIEGIVKGLKEEINQLQKPEQGGIFGALDNIQNLVDKYPFIGEILGNFAKQFMPTPTAAINGVNEMEPEFIKFINACGGLSNAKMILAAATPHIEKNGTEFLGALYSFINNYGKK
jgi:hypothetical protein